MESAPRNEMNTSKKNQDGEVSSQNTMSESTTKEEDVSRDGDLWETSSVTATNKVVKKFVGNETSLRKFYPVQIPIFEYSESEVEFISLLGGGSNGYVYKIRCGEKYYACKIHFNKARWDMIQKDVFDREAYVYYLTRDLQPRFIPQCYGYIHFKRWPKIRQFHSHEQSELECDEPLRINKETRGLILELLTPKPFDQLDISSKRLEDSGRKGLEKLLEIGIAHGDVKFREGGNALVVGSEEEGEKIVFVDFGLSMLREEGKDDDGWTFAEMADLDLKRWKRGFHEGTGLMAASKAKEDIKARKEPLPIALNTFTHSEDEIQFLARVGKGSNALVYKISCQGKDYACKIHYEDEAFTDFAEDDFLREADVYARTPDLQPYSIARCYGYIEFSKRPQLKHINSADRVPNDNFPQNHSIYGLVLELISHRPFQSSDNLPPRTLERSGREGLQKLHERGIVQGDPHRGNALIVKSDDCEERIVWIDFSNAIFKSEEDTHQSKSFKALADDELWVWGSYF